MGDVSLFATGRPYHILSYGTLFGATVFQTFVGGIIEFKTLPRPQFSQLQQAKFPIYFAMQAAMPAVLALTYPGRQSLSYSESSGIFGVLAENNRTHVLVPIATMFVTGVANMLYIGPQTTKVMRERKHQETRDGKKSYDAGPHSQEMQRLNKTFARMHGISSLVNLVAVIAMAWYGVTLSERL